MRKLKIALFLASAVVLPGVSVSSAQSTNSAYLGHGYRQFQVPDTDLLVAVTPQVCLSGMTPVGAGGTKSHWDIDFAQSNYEMEKFFGLQSAFGIKSPGIRVDANFDEFRKLKISHFNQAILAKVSFSFNETKADVKKPDYGFTSHGKPTQYFQECGTSYVSKVGRIAEYYVAFTVSLDTLEAQNSFAAAIKGKSGAYSASGAVQSTLHEISSTYTLIAHTVKVGNKLTPKDATGKSSEAAEDVIKFISTFGTDQGEALVESDAKEAIIEIEPYPFAGEMAKRYQGALEMHRRAIDLQKEVMEVTDQLDLVQALPGVFWPAPSITSVQALLDEGAGYLRNIQTSWTTCANDISNSASCSTTKFDAKIDKYWKDNQHVGILPHFKKSLLADTNNVQGVTQLNAGQVLVISIVGQVDTSGTGKEFHQPEDLVDLLYVLVSRKGERIDRGGDWPTLKKVYTAPFCVKGPAVVHALLQDDGAPTNNLSKNFAALIFEPAKGSDPSIVIGDICYEAPPAK